MGGMSGMSAQVSETEGTSLGGFVVPRCASIESPGSKHLRLPKQSIGKRKHVPKTRGA